MAINTRWKYARRISGGFVRLSETPNGPGIDVPRCLFTETLTEGKVYVIRRRDPDTEAEWAAAGLGIQAVARRDAQKKLSQALEAMAALEGPPIHHKNCMLNSKWQYLRMYDNGEVLALDTEFIKSKPLVGNFIPKGIEKNTLYKRTGDYTWEPCPRAQVPSPPQAVARRDAQKTLNKQMTRVVRSIMDRSIPQIQAIHKLKTWPKLFATSAAGDKPFEIRKNDRYFRVGDTLVLQEWDPITQKYSGKSLTRKITYIQPVSKSYVVMGLETGALCAACEKSVCTTCEEKFKAQGAAKC